ncbi:hypothetical protein O3P69_003394 [Scylla paramamosain]|uniref:Uncharacterized protein n=1 Tax=Scylla paramamosain TaxID=85552 RepID=A0AAW0UHU8_SCYPA
MPHDDFYPSHKCQLSLVLTAAGGRNRAREGCQTGVAWPVTTQVLPTAGSDRRPHRDLEYAAKGASVKAKVRMKLASSVSCGLHTRVVGTGVPTTATKTLPPRPSRSPGRCSRQTQWWLASRGGRCVPLLRPSSLTVFLLLLNSTGHF